MEAERNGMIEIRYVDHAGIRVADLSNSGGARRTFQPSKA